MVTLTPTYPTDRMTLDQLWHAVPSYPTATEVWLRLLEADRNP